MVYTPTTEEIQLRANLTRLMTLNEWDFVLVTEIMIYDNPTPNEVMRKINSQGIEVAYRELISSCEETEREVGDEGL